LFNYFLFYVGHLIFIQTIFILDQPFNFFCLTILIFLFSHLSFFIQPFFICVSHLTFLVLAAAFGVLKSIMCHRVLLFVNYVVVVALIIGALLSESVSN
jgi:hypothetical protein